MVTVDAVRYPFPGLHVYEGSVMSAGFTSRRIDQVRAMGFVQSDVLITTYPKSGTTWVQEVTWLLLHGCDCEAARSRLLDDRCPFLEREGPAPTPDTPDPAPTTPDPAPTAPRLFKTHLKEEVMRCALETGTPRVVVVMRNPKDVLVSQYHFYRMNQGLGAFPGTWVEFFEMFKNKELQFGYWYDHVRGWWERHNSNPNYHFVKYEDMKKNPRDTLRDLAAFLGVSVTEDQMQEVLTYTHFDQMKDNKMVNKEEWGLYDMNTSKFMRKGVVGDWKNHFTKEQSDFVDRLCDELTKQGLVFEFE